MRKRKMNPITQFVLSADSWDDWDSLSPEERHQNLTDAITVTWIRGGACFVALALFGWIAIPAIIILTLVGFADRNRVRRNQ
jgi:hypothetical protein